MMNESRRNEMSSLGSWLAREKAIAKLKEEGRDELEALVRKLLDEAVVGMDWRSGFQTALNKIDGVS